MVSWKSEHCRSERLSPKLHFRLHPNLFIAGCKLLLKFLLLPALLHRGFKGFRGRRRVSLLFHATATRLCTYDRQSS